MVRLTPDSLSQKIAFAAVAFGAIALILACVGLGTPKWNVGYNTANGNVYEQYNANFFYVCSYNSDGSLNNCVSRSAGLASYPGYSPSVSWVSDYGQRMQNAAALCIVGIVFIFLATVATLVMALIYFPTWANLIPPALFFLACLFMLIGMAEGSRYLPYNGYSANLYQAAHVVTMFALFLSALAAGRIHFSRWTEAGRNTGPK